MVSLQLNVYNIDNSYLTKELKCIQMSIKVYQLNIPPYFIVLWSCLSIFNPNILERYILTNMTKLNGRESSSKENDYWQTKKEDKQNMVKNGSIPCLSKE